MAFTILLREAIKQFFPHVDEIKSFTILDYAKTTTTYFSREPTQQILLAKRSSHVEDESMRPSFVELKHQLFLKM